MESFRLVEGASGRLSWVVWPGWALWTLMKVQKQMGRGFRSRNLLLFSVGQYGSLYGLGILNTWIPLPLGWLQPAASVLYRQAWATFVAFAHRTAQV